MEFLVSLFTAGGISALVVGVLYLLYKEMIRRDIFSRMKSGQTFVFFCLVAILVFGIALVVLLKSFERAEVAQNTNAKPSIEHFQADARYGLFCEAENVFSEFVIFYDFVQIQASKCSDTSKDGSIGFSVRRSSGSLYDLSLQERAGFRNCHQTDFPQFARSIYGNLNAALSSVAPASNGCIVAVVAVTRVVDVKYSDIYGEPKEAFYGFTYYGPDSDFDVSSISANSVVTGRWLPLITLIPSGKKKPHASQISSTKCHVLGEFVFQSPLSRDFNV
jgi:hypothetical protein